MLGCWVQLGETTLVHAQWNLCQQAPDLQGLSFSEIHSFQLKIYDVRPPQASLTNEMDPCGVIPINTFTMLWCLSFENVCALAKRFDGLSINISKQSIITLVLKPKESIKHFGIVLCNVSRSGQTINGDKRTSMTVDQVRRIREMTGLLTLKR